MTSLLTTSYINTMSGKRILDAIALLRATRNVAYNHITLRISQVELYTKTSSVFKAFRQRYPLTATRISKFSQSTFQQNAKSTIPQADKSARPQVHATQEAGIRQDHHYKRSEENTVAETAEAPGIEVEQAQAKRYPLPDGTIPSESSPLGQSPADPESEYRRLQTEQGQHPLDQSPDSSIQPTESAGSTIPTPTREPLAAEEVRIAQRQAEDPIPATVAEPPNAENEFFVDQEQDRFYQPPGQANPVLSALPRIRVPKIENDYQGGDSHIPKGINADVYYSGTQEGNAPELTEEQLEQLFRTPRAARLLGKKGKYMPGNKREYHSTTTKLQKNSETETQGLQQLAQDMATDIQDPSVSSWPLLIWLKLID